MTITDVARDAGVAPSTVSRAVTNPDRVNVVTREHVLETAERMGYRPSPVARALGSGRTSTLALVLPDITNPYFAGVIRGAERQAAAHAYRESRRPGASLDPVMQRIYDQARAAYDAGHPS